MNRAIQFAAITACAFQLATNPQSGAAEVNPPGANTQQAIGLEVWIVDVEGDVKDKHALEFVGPSEVVAQRLRDLESEGQVVVLDRVQLTTIENQQTLFQIGSTVPVAGGRSFFGRGGPPQMSFQQQSVGTLISATALADGDVIIVELQVEKSQLERRAEGSQSEDELVPLGTETLTSQGTLRIGSDKTVLAGGLESKAGAASSTLFVLASARLLEPVSDSKKAASAERVNLNETKIFSLQKTPAKDAAEVVRELLGDSSGRITVALDARTNSLIVSAEKPQDLDAIEAILLRLDQSDSSPVSKSPNEEKKADSKPRAGKYDKMEKKQLQEALKGLQMQANAAYRVAQEARSAAAQAKNDYASASDEKQAEALLHMIEADAASNLPLARHKKIRSTFEDAKRAYYQLLVAEENAP